MSRQLVLFGVVLLFAVLVAIKVKNSCHPRKKKTNEKANAGSPCINCINKYRSQCDANGCPDYAYMCGNICGNVNR